MAMNRAYDLIHQRKSSFDHTAWDTYDYLGLLDYSPKLQQLDEGYMAAHGRPIVQDAYFALQGLEPDPSDPLGKSWQNAIRTPEFQQLREQVGEDRNQLALAVINMARTVNRAIQDARKAELDRQVKAGERTRVDAAQGDMPMLPELLWHAVQDAEPGEEPEPVIAIGPAQIDKVAEETEAGAAFISSVGASLGGSAGEKFDQAIKLSELINVKEFANMLGWARKVVSGAAREHRGGTEELTGYRQNGWTSHTVATEMLAVADGEMHALANLADGNLTNRSYKSVKPQGKGPVILLRDESGSMGGHNFASRHRRALAFELALADAFNRDGRDLVCIRWSSGPLGVAEPYTHGMPGLEKHLGSFMDAGTEPLPAIERAIQVADEYVTGADILILTDGSFVDPQGTSYRASETLADFKAAGGRMWAVGFGDLTDGAARINFGFADGWVRVDELGQGEKTAQILASMAHRDSAGQKRRSL